VLKRHGLTIHQPRKRPHAYRPHPDATYPNAVHATDIITRWITGGEVVQTFNTVDIYSNDAYSTSHAAKIATAACEHLLQTWQQLRHLKNSEARIIGVSEGARVKSTNMRHHSSSNPKASPLIADSRTHFLI
jgi:hypothetical protein